MRPAAEQRAAASRPGDPTRALREAAGRSDAAAVAAILDAFGDRIVPRVLERLAGECMRGQRWAIAAQLLERVGAAADEAPAGADAGGGADVAARLRLCRNLASIWTHRPALHEALMTAGQESQCAVMRAADGKPTLVQTLPSGKPTCLTSGLAVDAALASAMAHLKPARESGYPVALLGVGDGYVLERLSREPTELSHGCEQAVYVLEPDAEVLLACLMLHDYTGSDGPIEQSRFYWAIGGDVTGQLQGWLESDAGLHPPLRTVTQSVRAGELDQAVAAVSERQRQADAALKQRVHERYAGLTREALVARLRQSGADRAPRVLLVTSRFTSVLQYATRDAAQAFEQIGWMADVLIEPSPHGRVTPRMLGQALLEFEPDVVFQIDHLRYEMPGLIPPQLPFVCWIQDNVAPLTCAEAGESVSERDFVLTNSIKFYTQTYRYPPRQCIYLNKLTRSVKLPASWETDGEDLVFVSHGSREPAALAEELTALVPDANGKRLMSAACRRLIAVYDAGGEVITTQQTERLLGEAEDDAGVRVRDPKLRRGLVQNLYDTLNNTLYRQQALEWVVSVAEARGMSVGLYGQGWEDHPRFARWARGPVAYGDELEALTRRSKLCLQIVPYGCLHQRLLDGLIAGGFFLVRLYEPEMVYWRMMRFIREHVPAEANDYHEALALLDEPAKGELMGHWRAWSDLNGTRDAPRPEVDPVRRVRDRERSGMLFLLDLPPRLEEVGFTDRATLEARIDRFANDDGLRREIAAAQRGFVQKHYTYERGLGRVMHTIARLIATEPGDSVPPPTPREPAHAGPQESDGAR